MKIYLCGKWADACSLREKMNELKWYGHTITHDWTFNNSNFPKQSSKLDIDGVRNADIVIAIMDDPEYAYRGTFTEIGCALGQRKNVLIVCPPLTDETKDYWCKTNCFFYHPQIFHYNSWEEVLTILNPLPSTLESEGEDQLDPLQKE